MKKFDVAMAAILGAIKTVRDSSTIVLTDAECLDRLTIGYDDHLHAEIERLNKCLHYEQHRAGRQGAAVMRAKGQAFYFLPLFGFADPEAVLAADTE